MEIALNIVVFLLIVGPFLTLLHELGHAIPALITTREEVTIRLGRTGEEKPDTAGLRLGRLRVVVYPNFMLGGFCHWTRGTAKRSAQVIFLASGPLASLLVAVLIWLLDMQFSPDLGLFNRLPSWAGAWSFFTFAVTILPIQYPSWWGAYGGRTSDGYKIVRLLKQE